MTRAAQKPHYWNISSQKSRIFLLIAIVLSFAYPAGARDYRNCQTLLRSELQSTINRLKRNDFTIGRSLRQDISPFATYAYEDILGSTFIPTIESLDLTDHWIDIGMGAGKALFQFMYEKGYAMPFLTGINYSTPWSYYWHRFHKRTPSGRAKFKYYGSHNFENMDLSTIPKANVVTDVYGPLSYTSQLSYVLKRELSLLKPNGYLFSIITWGISIPYDESAPALRTFLEKIRGIKIISYKFGKFVLQRTHEPLEVPRLKLIDFTDGAPPERRFELMDGYEMDN